MGYIRHHSIVVTSWNKNILKKAHKKAKKLFDKGVSNIVDSKMNGYVSFFIAPDGSKEGWPDSFDGDEKRDKFIKWIKSHDNKDGSNSLSFCEFFYGDDNGDARIERHN